MALPVAAGIVIGIGKAIAWYNSLSKGSKFVLVTAGGYGGKDVFWQLYDYKFGDTATLKENIHNYIRWVLHEKPIHSMANPSGFAVTILPTPQEKLEDNLRDLIKNLNDAKEGSQGQVVGTSYDDTVLQEMLKKLQDNGFEEDIDATASPKWPSLNA